MARSKKSLKFVDGKEHHPFEMIDLFEDATIIPSISKLTKISDDFFSYFEESLFIFIVGGRSAEPICHFFVPTAGLSNEVYISYKAFISAYLKA